MNAKSIWTATSCSLEWKRFLRESPTLGPAIGSFVLYTQGTYVRGSCNHIGIEGSLRCVRECLFWPRMASDVKDYVSKCDVCLAHPTSQTKKPLFQHEVIPRPWAKLAAYLCELHRRTLLVVTDYFSNYIEVARLSATSTQTVVRELKTMFARFGISEILVTDNGPQFSSNEFQVFARGWSFNYVTTSPRYPQSNGKVENAVRTVKRLFENAKKPVWQNLSSSWLANYASWGDGYQPGTAPDGTSMPYVTSDVRVSFTTKLLIAWLSACVGPNEKWLHIVAWRFTMIYCASFEVQLY